MVQAITKSIRWIFENTFGDVLIPIGFSIAAFYFARVALTDCDLMEVSFTGGYQPVTFGYNELTNFNLTQTPTENQYAEPQCFKFNDPGHLINYDYYFRDGALSKAASNVNTATIFTMLSIVWLVLVKIYLLVNPFKKIYRRPKGSLQIWSIPGQLFCEIAFVLQFAGLTNILDEKKSICDKNRYDPDDFGGVMDYNKDPNSQHDGYQAWANFDECNFSKKGQMALLAIIFLAVASTMLIIFSCIEFTEDNDEDEDLTPEQRRAARMSELAHRQSLAPGNPTIPPPYEEVPGKEDSEEEYFEDSAMQNDVALQPSIRSLDDDGVSFATEIENRIITDENDDDISHNSEGGDEDFLPDKKEKRGFRKNIFK